MTDKQKQDFIKKLRQEHPKIEIPDDEIFVKDTDGKEYLSLAVRWQLDAGQAILAPSKKNI